MRLCPAKEFVKTTSSAGLMIKISEVLAVLCNKSHYFPDTCEDMHEEIPEHARDFPFLSFIILDPDLARPTVEHCAHTLT